MTTMIAEVYDAFKSAGADDGKARAAASAVADRAATSAVADQGRDIADLKADVRAIKWVGGVILAIALANFALLWRLSLAAG